MIWSSVGLLLAVSLVNTKGLSIHGEEGATIQGDEVEQELEVSEVMLLGGITDLFHNCEQNIIKVKQSKLIKFPPSPDKPINQQMTKNYQNTDENL